MRRENEDMLYMEIASSAASMSVDPKHGVGCAIVTPDDMITLGWNGTPPGHDNDTRFHAVTECAHGVARLEMVTKPTVMHAEFNALSKFSGSTASAEGARMYTTHGPCIPCALHTIRAKIREVVYQHVYERSNGLPLLQASGVIVRKVGE
ncbi:cytidine/deoxycytidine deaminase [Burkholderia phage BcepSaruman]|uniref:Cytidine/deoxycytidine deaminase n=1 Tax=Burkholderia phage BcepSaruman TaxID=2530032 RepID=A0A4D5ZCJ3_9CAUD|nr:cytidine/deoxycytidine deaminase [Burkholderia phage BcepSaruman]QBX06511.1 cytidine/deoxycytidine deaminase [Burkholderia phage BcepSaruman]